MLAALVSAVVLDSSVNSCAAPKPVVGVPVLLCRIAAIVVTVLVAASLAVNSAGVSERNENPLVGVVKPPTVKYLPVLMYAPVL